MYFLNAEQTTEGKAITNGVWQADRIVFAYTANHPYFPDGSVKTDVEYEVIGGQGLLAVEGRSSSGPICCDIPHLFEHKGVSATAEPEARIRVSEVEISWNSVSNTVYQVQYRPETGTGRWEDLGDLEIGDGSVMHLVDKVPPGSTQRLYRVIRVQ
jgi:hypothetical protein